MGELARHHERLKSSNGRRCCFGDDVIFFLVLVFNYYTLVVYNVAVLESKVSTNDLQLLAWL